MELKAPARKGKANTALAKLLSNHFGRGVRIVGGLTSRDKILEKKKLVVVSRLRNAVNALMN